MCCSYLSSLTRWLQGVSPSLVQELCGLAGVAPSSPPAALLPEEWTALHAEWRRWLQVLEQGQRGMITALLLPSLLPLGWQGAMIRQHGAARAEPLRGTVDQASQQLGTCILPAVTLGCTSEVSATSTF